MTKIMNITYLIIKQVYNNKHTLPSFHILLGSSPINDVFVNKSLKSLLTPNQKLGWKKVYELIITAIVPT